jgi:hypothetical protein
VTKLIGALYEYAIATTNGNSDSALSSDFKYDNNDKPVEAHVKVKQSNYRPGVAQRFPGS